jgi:hypothetical protein
MHPARQLLQGGPLLPAEVRAVLDDLAEVHHGDGAGEAVGAMLMPSRIARASFEVGEEAVEVLVVPLDSPHSLGTFSSSRSEGRLAASES